MSFSAVSDGDQARVYATLVSAFMDDPVERWLYPESQQYLTHFPEFLAAFGGRAFDEHTVWSLGDFSAVALWLPPGTEADGEQIVAVLTDSASPGLHGDLFAVLDQMDEAHPDFPHWYLPWFGVDTALQGTGLGGQLMRRCLQIVDVDHLPVLSRNPQSTERPLLRTSRVRGHWRGASGDMPADRVHAEGGAIVDRIISASRSRCRDRVERRA